MSGNPKSVWPLAAELGEGPVWHGDALWFVDIKKQSVHRFSPDGAGRTWAAPEQVGFILPATGGGFIAGLQSGLARFDPSSGTFEPLVAVEPEVPTNRLNDGVTDPSGRLWFGTMDNGERAPTGAFYCFRRGVVRHTGLSGIAITNGPAVSPDGKSLYWIDTLRGTMTACAIGDDGELGESRTIVRIPPDEGFPDGPTADAEGCVWISLYAGWEARRYAPSGELLERIAFPVANITKIAFGGTGLTTAYATTARHGMSAEDIAAQPHSGDLFEFTVDVPGISCPSIDA